MAICSLGIFVGVATANSKALKNLAFRLYSCRSAFTPFTLRVKTCLDLCYVIASISFPTSKEWRPVLLDGGNFERFRSATSEKQGDASPNNNYI